MNHCCSNGQNFCERVVGKDALLLKVNHLTKSYDGVVNSLDDVSFSLGKGELVSIIGSSGAGKSTLLRCVNRLIDATSGSVLFNGVEMNGLRGRRLRAARRQISMIFQSYNLVYRSSSIENVLQGRLGYKNSLTGALSLFSEEEKIKAFQMLERVGMSDFSYTRTDQLSGGQKQRVGIARALVQDPLLILADEPIASLDPRSSREVMELLRSVVDEMGITCLVSLHQVEYALEYSDYIFGLSKGKICCQGAPQQLDAEKIYAVYQADEA